MTSAPEPGCDCDRFYADLDRFDEAFERLGAIRTGHDGREAFTCPDPAKAPADMIQAYQRLLRHGYANGLI